MASGPQPKKSKTANRARQLFTMEVSLREGPVTEEFLEEHPRVIRTIEIRGDQTLEDLHNAIFEAFDRADEHMYEFQVGGKGFHDPDGKRYVLPMAMDEPFDDVGKGPKIGGSVDKTNIAALGLQAGQSFGYWFDFGDDWYHQIDVLTVSDEVPQGKFPRITHRVGDSPPQYPDLEDDEEDLDGEEDDMDEEEEEDET